MESRSIWRRRSTVVFFAIAFGIPWVCWTAHNLLHLEPRRSALSWALFLTGDFCSVAGVVATWVDRGSSGVKELLRRAVDWRHGIGWWLYALLLPVLWGLAATAAFGLSRGQSLSSFQPVLVIGLFTWARFSRYIITGPLGEEFGWRGFLLPRLLSQYSPLTASLILGLIWAVWHYPLYYNTVFASAEPAALFVGSVLAFSVMMTVMFVRTKGSLLLQMVFHYTVNVAPAVVQDILHGVNTDGRAFPLVKVAALVLFAIVTITALRLARGRRMEPPRTG